jgi:hypothetical protein
MRRDLMAHKIAEAIIENGEIKYINRKLPHRRMKVHLIYDVGEETISTVEASKIVQETSGIYKDIDAETESRRLRTEWERNVHN